MSALRSKTASGQIYIRYSSKSKKKGDEKVKRIKLTLFLTNSEVSVICDTEEEVFKCVRIINTFCDEMGINHPGMLMEEAE